MQQSLKSNSDIIILGGGIIGINMCRHLAYKYPDLKIKLVEKELQLGTHSSTRNSGVLHAGFYYK